MSTQTPDSSEAVNQILDDLYKTLDLRILNTKERIAYRQVIDKIIMLKSEAAVQQASKELLYRLRALSNFYDADTSYSREPFMVINQSDFNTLLANLECQQDGKESENG